jgi:hypothetical protein
MQRPDPYDLARDFFPTIILNGEDETVFPRFSMAGMTDCALDFQGRESRDRPTFGADGVKL